MRLYPRDLVVYSSFSYLFEVNTSLIEGRKSGDLSVFSGVTLAALTGSRGYSHGDSGMGDGCSKHCGQL
jgi:hypothetical protein